MAVGRELRERKRNVARSLRKIHASQCHEHTCMFYNSASDNDAQCRQLFDAKMDIYTKIKTEKKCKCESEEENMVYKQHFITAAAGRKYKNKPRRRRKYRWNMKIGKESKCERDKRQITLVLEH